MRRFVGSALAAGAVVAVTAATTPALMIAMKSPSQRALTADVVVVGKVTAIEKEAVEAAPFPGAPQKVAYRVAVVKVETPLAGADNLTHLKVGFIPAPPPAPPQPVVPGQPRIGRPIGRPGFGTPELKEGQEYVFFLTRHPDAGFHVMPMTSPPLDAKSDEAKKDVDAIRKLLAIIADPTKALKAPAAADRAFAATALITKYRSYPEMARGMVDQVAIPAEESRMILAALAESDWTKFDRGAPNGMQAFYSLNLTETDGWVAPKPAPRAPGQPAVNFNQVTKDAFVKWLDGPGKDYRIKRIVAAPKK